MKHWKLDIIDYWVTGAGCLMEKGLKLSSSPPNCSEDFGKIFPLLIYINWPSLLGYWVVVQKIYSKMHPISCINTHHDVTDLVNLWEVIIFLAEITFKGGNCLQKELLQNLLLQLSTWNMLSLWKNLFANCSHFSYDFPFSYIDFV